MSGFSDHSRDMALNHVFRNGNCYVAVFNGTSEVSASGYARKPVTFSAPESAPGGGRRVRNSSAVEFDEPQANWGTVDAAAIYDSETGGNRLSEIIPLEEPREVPAGDQAIRFPAGDLSMEID
ncbi:hypothetical protein LRF89_06575 [Halorhodospira sp. 9621]|uniref:phage tail fiber protein n=1 Tax=Halorhodospira sp. 9621 TaxID=2899135 RepID=UPI001EE9337D|nr:hypothetical protein [Halorhodospira sp. 9621]MCG5533105.1 hypothetical protein [Halorhodospira sp. 9621]